MGINSKGGRGKRSINGPNRRGKQANVTVLTPVDEADFFVPPLPFVEDYCPTFIYKGPRRECHELVGNSNGWSPAVVEWWIDIWASPMAREFVKSDIHELYLGGVALQIFTLSGAEALKSGSKFLNAWHSVNRNFGLNPSARESLRWQIAQGAMADRRTEQIRGEKRKAVEKGSDSVVDLYSQHAGSPG